MTKQVTYHEYLICVHGSCDKPSKYDVVGSEAAPFGSTVSVCELHFQDIEILQLTYEDEGEEGLDFMKGELGFYWKEEFLDKVFPNPPWVK